MSRSLDVNDAGMSNTSARFAYLQELTNATATATSPSASSVAAMARSPRCTQADVEQRKSNAEELFLDKVMRVTRRAV